MASTLKVQNIAHTAGTTGISIDTTGIVTHPLKSHFRVFRHGQGSVQSNQTKCRVTTGQMTFTEESIVSSDQTSGINYIGNHYKAPQFPVEIISFILMVFLHTCWFKCWECW